LFNKFSSSSSSSIRYVREPTDTVGVTYVWHSLAGLLGRNEFEV